MKKLLSLTLAMLLLVGLCSTAFATEPQYASTKAFLALMDQKGINYSVEGIDANGYEKVYINNTDSDINYSYTIKYFFDDNGENCSLRVWDIITFADEDFAKVLRTVNSLNCQYKYVYFTVEESDNTVTASIDTIFRTHDIDQILWEATLYVVDIIEAGYPSLSVYDQ
jgi:hypothetical protein